MFSVNLKIQFQFLLIMRLITGKRLLSHVLLIAACRNKNSALANHLLIINQLSKVRNERAQINELALNIIHTVLITFQKLPRVYAHKATNHHRTATITTSVAITRAINLARAGTQIKQQYINHSALLHSSKYSRQTRGASKQKERERERSDLTHTLRWHAKQRKKIGENGIIT